MIKLKVLYKGPDYKLLEQFIDFIVSACKKQKIKYRGPVHLPNQKLKLHVRKSPCGEGSGTITHYHKIVRKKVIYIDNFKILTQIPSEILHEDLIIEIQSGQTVEIA